MSSSLRNTITHFHNNDHADKLQGTITQRRPPSHLRPATTMGEKQPLHRHRLPAHLPFLPRLPVQLDLLAQRDHEHLLTSSPRLSSSLPSPPRRPRSDGQSRITDRATDGGYPGLRRLLPWCASVYGLLSRLPHADEPLASGGGPDQAVRLHGHHVLDLWQLRADHLLHLHV